MSRRRRPPNGSPAQRVPFGEEKQGSGRGMPARAFRGKADFASTSWRFSNRIQAGRPTRAGAHCAPLRRETHPIRPCGRQAAAGGPKRQPSGSGCRLERRSKGAGEECPPGRSEVKRTLLRRHGRSQAGRGMSRRRRPPNGSPAQRVPFGEEKQGSGRGMPPRAFRDKADFASTSWRFSNRIQAGRPTRAGAHCAPLRRETHPIRPCGRQAAAGGPQTAAPE